MQIKLQAVKTYATEANAVKAVEKFPQFADLRYFIAVDDIGRFFPVFIGEAAVQAGVHFKFNVVG